MLRLPSTTGTIVDRYWITRIKVTRLSGEGQLVAIRKFAEIEPLYRQAVTRLDLNVVAQFHLVSAELQQVNEQLWDLENKVREESRRLGPVPSEVTPAICWLSELTTGNFGLARVVRYLQATQRIREFNKRRWELSAELDDLASEEPEPKQYFKEEVDGRAGS